MSPLARRPMPMNQDDGQSHERVDVSDHAVVRYMERVLGVDVDGVRAEIANKIRNPEKYAQFLRGTTAKVRTEGTVFVITTYLEDKQDKRKGRPGSGSSRRLGRRK